MPAFETGLYSYLSNYAPLVALVSNRIYPNIAPHEATYPLVVYQKISGPREATHDGNAGLARPRFQFSCYSPDYLAAKNVALRVVQGLHGFSGLMGTFTTDAFIDNELDLFDEETRNHRIVVDALIWHNEDVS